MSFLRTPAAQLFVVALLCVAAHFTAGYFMAPGSELARVHRWTALAEVALAGLLLLEVLRLAAKVAFELHAAGPEAMVHTMPVARHFRHAVMAALVAWVLAAFVLPALLLR